MIYNTEFFEEQDLLDLFEDTFDTCNSKKEEIIWLICMIRGLLNIKNKCVEVTPENMQINHFQYWLHPVIERYKKKWHQSNYE